MKIVFKISVLVFCFSLLSREGKAQHIPVSNHYFVNPYSISPANAGYNQKAQVYLGYREQWTSMPESPVTAMVNFVYPVNSRVWLGAEVLSHESSIFRNINARLSYTYRLPIAENQVLSFGLWGNVVQNSIALDEITVNDLNDPLLTGSEQLNGLSLNAGAALMYQYDGLLFGISVPALIELNNEYSVDAGENTLNTGSRFLMFGRYNWQLHEKWQLIPSVVFRYVKNTPFNIDLLNMLEYEGKYRFGIYYRSESIVGITLGGYLTEKINLNYSWGFENNGYTPYTAGTHEFTLGYELNTGGTKSKRKRSKGGKYPDAILYNEKYRR